MINKPCYSFLRVALLVPIVVAMFIGCAGKQRRAEILMLQEELNQQNTRNKELEQKNAKLKNRLEEAGDIKTLEYEPDVAKSMLESEFAGTGITVQATAWQIKLLLPSSVLFKPGKSTLSSGSKHTLRRVANTIKTDFPNAVVRIEGHTDNVPIKKTKKKYKSNWELSADRAATVAHFFVNKCRLDPKRIYIAGFGEYRPISSNKTKAGRKKNRRVEIVILSRDSGQSDSSY